MFRYVRDICLFFIFYVRDIFNSRSILFGLKVYLKKKIFSYHHERSNDIIYPNKNV